MSDLGDRIKSGQMTRSDMRDLAAAARRGWQIPEEWLDTLPQEAYRIAIDPGRKPRDRLRAIDLLRAMRRDNELAALAQSIRDEGLRVVVAHEDGSASVYRRAVYGGTEPVDGDAGSG